jgi:2,3-bisphosphoglycerate-independent phosphoglycerate mutase
MDGVYAVTRVLFLFLDGVGLGDNDPQKNPLVKAHMPHLESLLEGCRLVRECAPLETSRASLLSLDATLGVPGMPQSATGQAALLTGQNVPAILGYHYGPKPNPAVAETLMNGNLFSKLLSQGRKAAYLNAFPPAYFSGINSGRRIYSAIPMAAVHAGIPLMEQDDLIAGRALSADFTARGWRDQLGLADAPLLTPRAAGERLAQLASGVDFALFEFWLSDIAGHRQEIQSAVQILENLDKVLGGLFENWDDQQGLILITSDHGNLEDLTTRRHTLNYVPALLVGNAELRRLFARDLHRIDSIAPAVLRLLIP